MEKSSIRADVAGTIQVHSSKTYAQRAVAAALLCEGETTLLNMELCSDTQAALRVAQSLGASAEQTDSSTYKIKGGFSGGSLAPVDTTIDIGESGLSARMFTPIASLCTVPVTIIGHGSIVQRPVDMMV